MSEMGGEGRKRRDKMLKSSLLLAVVGWMLSPAYANEPLRMTAADLAFDIDRSVGKRVTVTDCILVQAQFDRALCPILTKTGMAGVLSINYAASDRASREKAVNSCTTLDPKIECFAEVTGVVRKSEMGGVIGLERATLRFPRR